jgi:hypothetical protein
MNLIEMDTEDPFEFYCPNIGKMTPGPDYFGAADATAHYKVNEYAVLGVARHREMQELAVGYPQEYGDRGLWVRPMPMFNEAVMADGRPVPRFHLLEPLTRGSLWLLKSSRQDPAIVCASPFMSVAKAAARPLQSPLIFGILNPPPRGQFG